MKPSMVAIWTVLPLADGAVSTKLFPIHWEATGYAVEKPAPVVMSPDVAVLLVALAFVLMVMVRATGSPLTTCVLGRKYVGSPMSWMFGYHEVLPAMLPV